MMHWFLSWWWLWWWFAGHRWSAGQRCRRPSGCRPGCYRLELQRGRLGASMRWTWSQTRAQGSRRAFSSFSCRPWRDDVAQRGFWGVVVRMTSCGTENGPVAGCFHRANVRPQQPGNPPRTGFLRPKLPPCRQHSGNTTQSWEGTRPPAVSGAEPHHGDAAGLLSPQCLSPSLGRCRFGKSSCDRCCHKEIWGLVG